MLLQGVAERLLQAAEVSKGPTHPTHRWCPQVQLLCDGVHHHGQGFRRAPHHGLGLSIAMEGLLIHHRGNWYLGAWCHQQEAMRSFAMDAIEQASVLNKASKSMPKKALDGFVGHPSSTPNPVFPGF